MTQKIFDTDNAEDMALLWSILPEDIEEICVENGGYTQFCYKKVGPGERSVSCLNLIQIDWHDKTEITRPIKEATKEDYKKLCLFRDDNSSKGVVGVLSAFDSESVRSRYYMEGGTWWGHCRRLTKQEIEELC